MGRDGRRAFSREQDKLILEVERRYELDQISNPRHEKKWVCILRHLQTDPETSHFNWLRGNIKRRCEHVKSHIKKKKAKAAAVREFNQENETDEGSGAEADEVADNNLDLNNLVIDDLVHPFYISSLAFRKRLDKAGMSFEEFMKDLHLLIPELPQGWWDQLKDPKLDDINYDIMQGYMRQRNKVKQRNCRSNAAAARGGLLSSSSAAASASRGSLNAAIGSDTAVDYSSPQSSQRAGDHSRESGASSCAAAVAASGTVMATSSIADLASKQRNHVRMAPNEQEDSSSDDGSILEALGISDHSSRPKKRALEEYQSETVAKSRPRTCVPVKFSDGCRNYPSIRVETGYSAQFSNRMFTDSEWRKMICYDKHDLRFQLEHSDEEEWRRMLSNTQMTTNMEPLRVKMDFFRYAVPKMRELMKDIPQHDVFLFMEAINTFSCTAMFHGLEEYTIGCIRSTIRRMIAEKTLSIDLLSLNQWVAGFCYSLNSKPMGFFHASEPQFMNAQQNIGEDVYAHIFRSVGDN